MKRSTNGKESKTMYGYGRFFDEWSERDLTDMIRRDRNHPSIILWSIGNEIPEQDNANAYEMSKRLVDICHKEDPTRPVTSGCNSPEAAIKSGFSKPLDVLGINYSMPFYQTLKGKAKLIASETASAVSTRGEYNLVQDEDSLKIEKELNNQCTSYDIAAPVGAIRRNRPSRQSKVHPGLRVNLCGRVSITSENHRPLAGRQSVLISVLWICAVSQKTGTTFTRVSGRTNQWFTFFRTGTGKVLKDKKYRFGVTAIVNRWNCFFAR